MRTIMVLMLAMCVVGCASKQAPVAEHSADAFWDDQTAAVAPDVVSLTGTDRSGWPKIQVAAVNGRVPHHPVYMKQPWVLRPHRPSPFYRDDRAGEKSLVAALSEEKHDLSRDIVQLGLSPVGFGLELLALPTKAVVKDQPWDVRHSP